jgi:phosphomannomutase
MIHNLVVNTLIGLGIDVRLGFVHDTYSRNSGSLRKLMEVILTASHPKQWNGALKLLNGKGEFLNGMKEKNSCHC